MRQQTASTFHRLGSIAAAAVMVGWLVGCPSGGTGAAGSPQWPHASKLATQPLPGNTSWTGVYFINTGGSRGTMHLFATGVDSKVHGCWIAEDKHAKATFVGTEKDNVVMLDWTEKRVGFAGAPVHVTGYFVMSPDPDLGKDKIKGEYGADVSSDSGSLWEGIRLLRQEPKEGGCNIEEGEAIPTETKPLE